VGSEVAALSTPALGFFNGIGGIPVS